MANNNASLDQKNALAAGACRAFAELVVSLETGAVCDALRHLDGQGWLVADGAISVRVEGAEVSAGAGADVGAAAAMGAAAAERAAAARSFFFFATGFFGGVAACRST